jgi:Bacterial transglutaminase-like N-terminal region
LSILNVRHTTVYRYRCPVALGDHRLTLRPRDSHDLRLIQTNLNLSPPATLRWSHDVFGNSIATHCSPNPPPNCGSRAVSDWRQAFQITPEAVSYPFIYSPPMIVSTSAECSSAIILILPIAYNGARLPEPAQRL